MFIVLLLGLALVHAQTHNVSGSNTTTVTATNSTGSSGNATNATIVATTNTTGPAGNTTNTTTNTTGAQGQASSSTEASSTEASSTEASSTESGQGQSNQTSKSGQQGKGSSGTTSGTTSGIRGRMVPCQLCGAACATPQIINGVCNMKLKCVAKRSMPPNCPRPGGKSMTAINGQGQLSSTRLPIQGQPSATIMNGQFTRMPVGQGQLTSMNGQLNSVGQGQMTSMNGQLSALSMNSCAALNCPLTPPICQFPSILQTPIFNGCPGCPTCSRPIGGCTVDAQCSAGTYCVLGRCLTYAQEGDSCGTLVTPLCQPPMVCTVMGTCYMPDCSCGFLPCPLDQQITTQPDTSLVTGGCPPCPTCKS